jgi:hypothetical protein
VRTWQFGAFAGLVTMFIAWGVQDRFQLPVQAFWIASSIVAILLLAFAVQANVPKEA